MNFIAYFQHSNYLRRVYNGTFILKAAYSLRYRVLWEYRVLGAETPESKWNPNPSEFKEHFILQVKIRTLHNFFSHLYRIFLYPENISSTAECFSLFFKLFTREVHVNSVIIHLSAVCEITQMVPPAAPGLHECTYKASSPVWFCGEMLSERSSDNKMFILKCL